MNRDKLIQRAEAECRAIESCYPALWRAYGLEEACECTRNLVDTLWDDFPRAFPDDKELLRGYCRELQNAFNRGHGGAPGYFSPVLAKIRAYLTAKATPPKPPEPEPEPEPAPAPAEPQRKGLFGIFKS